MNRSDKMKEKKITLKNYLIISLIFVVTIGITLYLCDCYRVYNESKKEIPVIRGTLSEITSKDLEHYIMENQSAVIYMCTASNSDCRNYEKDFKKLIIKKNLQEKIIYLNISDVDQEEYIAQINEKYQSKTKLTTNYPAIILFEEGKITSILQGDKKEKLSITKTKQFIEFNKIGE